MGDEVLSKSTVSIQIADVYTELFPRMKDDREFFGLVDSKGTTLQAMYYAEDDLYWFEVPRPDLEGAFGAYLTFDDAADLIKSISGDFPLEGYPGFEFNLWQSGS